MENLGTDVVEVVSGEACSIQKAGKVLLPVAAVIGFGVLVVTLFKRHKAKKAAVVVEEVNPEN